jgi:hypothetical protein
MSQQLLTNCGLDCYGGSEGYPDDKLVKTTRGMIRADLVQAATSATLSVAGVDANGAVSYQAAGGRWGNEITVEHLAGDLGAGNLLRALAVTVQDKAVTVTFGTDAVGASVVPTATDLAAAINADPDASKLVTATPGGDGSSLAGLFASANLAGGANDGDYLCVGPGGRYTAQVNTRRTI